MSQSVGQLNISWLREQHCECIAVGRVCRATSYVRSVAKNGRLTKVWRADKEVYLNARDVINKGAFKKFCKAYGVAMNVDSFSLLFDRYWQDMFVYFTKLYTERYKDLQQEDQDWLEYVIGIEIAREILERKAEMGKLAFADPEVFRVVVEWQGYKEDCNYECSIKSSEHSEDDPIKVGRRRIIPGHRRIWGWERGKVANNYDKKIEGNYVLYQNLRLNVPLLQLPSAVNLPKWF